MMAICKRLPITKKTPWAWLALLAVVSPAAAQESLLPLSQSVVAPSPAMHVSSRNALQPSLVQEAVAPEQQASDTPTQTGESLAPIQNRELTTEVNVVSISIVDIGTGVLPEDASYPAMTSQAILPDGVARGFAHKHVYWRPSLVFHHPLYFEDAMLERHGHDRFGYLQPIASGVKFFGELALYPYLRTLQPPCECQYALGHYRAGSCAPLLKDHLPWDYRAAATELLALESFFWAAPL